MKNTIYIGDIAGRLKELKKVYNKYRSKKKICLGDLQDRGLYSKQVLDFLMSRDDTKALFGNHEQLFVLFMETEEFSEDWVTFLMNGGLETIASYLKGRSKNKFLKLKDEIRFYIGMYWNTYVIRYKINYKHEDFYESREYLENKYKIDSTIEYLKHVRKQIPQKYVDYIKSLPRYIETDEIIISHAPVSHYPLDKRETQFDDFIWNRTRIPNLEKDNIHGHNTYRSVKKLDNGKRFICVDDCGRDRLNIYDWDEQSFDSFPYED